MTAELRAEPRPAAPAKPPAKPASRRKAEPAEPARPAQDGPSRRRGRPRLISPLTLRILAVNVLAALLLLGGLLYLGQYQQRLINAELDALTVEGRISAAALAEGAIEPGYDEFADGLPELSFELGRQMVRRLVETTDTRTRLYAATGELVADSRVLGGPQGTVQIEPLPPLPDSSPLTQLGRDIYDRVVNAVPGREHLPRYPMNMEADATRFPDVQKALAGEVGRGVWRIDRGDGTEDMLLTVAVPVQRFKQVLGAVYLSRTGREIDEAVRQVRMDMLKFSGIALAVTVLLSIYLARTIARPISRLAEAADEVRHGHGRQAVIPDMSRRHDEIGDLSVALKDMTAAIWDRMDAIERFAADVAHEIKNPLTSMRSAVETVQRVKTDEQRSRLLAIIHEDVQRLDRLISDISNASRLDAELSRAQAQPVDLRALLEWLAGLHDETICREDEGGDGDPAVPKKPKVRVELPPPSGRAGDLTVPGIEGRLTQVFQNLVSNALSFSPAGGLVLLSARAWPDRVEVTCADQGPGIPEAKLDAIFDRFYSERPKSEAFGKHSGLGLSISKQIVDAHGGRIFAENIKDADGAVQGAQFTVVLPR
ncbi:stimulus-sensing domain-containing protein [Indioceanicola profundi]|uniref:stimulus-sensing domain-containing protein n=1 Tax=Indioceanicola profundi TaxID=2220096 RepID=UPI000E6AC023|nr:stimulus-sensing domain-containing protein [Indioceanicola profundi]